MTKAEAREAALRGLVEQTDLYKRAQDAQQMGTRSAEQFMRSRQRPARTSSTWQPRAALMDDDETAPVVPDTQGAMLKLDVEKKPAIHPLHSQLRALEGAMERSGDKITKEVFDAAESLFKAAKAQYENRAQANAMHRKRFVVNVPAPSSSADNLDALMLNFNEDLMFQ